MCQLHGADREGQGRDQTVRGKGGKSVCKGGWNDSWTQQEERMDKIGGEDGGLAYVEDDDKSHMSTSTFADLTSQSLTSTSTETQRRNFVLATMRWTLMRCSEMLMVGRITSESVGNSSHPTCFGTCPLKPLLR